MKKLLLIAMIVVSQSILADGISVISFKLLETDLTANTRGTERRDQNGDKAALIKIVTPERGFRYDGGSLGIVGTEEKTGEIWLYVPPRAQKLTISHQVFGVMRDYYYPTSIQGGRTYEMLLDIGTGRYVTITTEEDLKKKTPRKKTEKKAENQPDHSSARKAENQPDHSSARNTGDHTNPPVDSTVPKPPSQYVAGFQPKPAKAIAHNQDEWIGLPCPKCKQGHIIKGRAAYGCSRWKEGCDWRMPFA